MRLRGIDFGPVLDASGVRNFFGDGYWFHKPWKHIGLDFTGSTFVTKTTTVLPREGNMLVDLGGKPYDRFPDCIIVKPIAGVVLNAVGLSGPGAEDLLESGQWQKRQKPFIISFMSVAKTKRERKNEFFEFLQVLKEYMSNFQAPFGLQINFSCPNVDVEFDEREFLDEVSSSMTLAKCYGDFPLMPKFNVVLDIEVVREIASWSICDAICISNTIPWGSFPNKVDWKRIFGSMESPLAKYGGGGLSGKPLLPLVVSWVRNAREAGITVPINAGGGILHPRDVRVLFDVGADSIFVGSAAILRPWRVKSIIRYAHAIALQRR